MFLHLDPTTSTILILALGTMKAAFQALRAFFDRSRKSRSSTRRLPPGGATSARRKESRRGPRSGAKPP